MAIIKEIVERRVNQTGVSEPVVVTQGSDRVVVELPGVTDPDSVRQLVGQTGRLDFVPLGQTQVQEGQVLDLKAFPPLFSGDQVQSALARPEPAGRADGRLRPQGRRREALRRLHGRPRRRLLRDHPRRLGDLRAGHPQLDPQRPGPDRVRRHRRLPGQGGQQPRHDPQVRLAAVPDQGGLERADQRDARRRSS